jgi:hypothetical protein
MSTIEENAAILWRRWGNGWALYTACSNCGEVRQCRGRRRARMLCLECFDQGGA